jgi:succinate-semialdehyde dehydrogenase/glutarate-semialdehyde dehydrogenase
MPTLEKEILKYNPATGALLFQIPFSTHAQVQTGLQHAKEAQHHWQNVSLKQRLFVLEKVERLLKLEAENLVQLVTQEVGKPQAEALQTDLFSALMGLQHVIKEAPKHLKPQYKNTFKGVMLGRVFKQVRMPYGVVAIISPWNYPLGTPIPAMANALLAGNAVAFKPSEKTPKSGELVARLFQDALQACGYSSNLVQLFQGDGTVGQALVEAPETDFVLFTGSEAVGRRIQVQCATRNIPCSLELGGSDALVILPSAERYSLDAVVSHALLGRFANAGQTCAAIKKLYVPSALLPIIQELLLAKLAQIRVGDPINACTHMGPLIDETQHTLLTAQLQDALEKGCTVHSGQSVLNEEPRTSFFSPTVVMNPPASVRICQEEVFGPILPVFAYDDLGQVIEEINASPYGLGASIFGKPKQAEWLGKQLQVANIGINELHMMFYAFPQVEWRGLKHTGPGVRSGVDGLVQFSQVKTFGKAFGFSLFPFLQKSPFLFDKQANHMKDSFVLLRTITSRKWWRMLSPSLLRFLWMNRGDTKL